MKKFMFLMAVLTAMFMNAQTIEQPRFIDNTYIRVEGGATALTHPGCNGYENWGHTIQGVVGAEVGKWITPKFGVAFEGDFGIRNGSKSGIFNYRLITPDGDAAGAYLKKSQRFNYINVTGLVKFNMSNIIAGFNPNRKWEFVMATGPMWIHGFPGKDYINDFGVKFKAEVDYNINYRWQLNLIPEFNYNLTGNYSYGTREHPRFDSRNSWYALKVGVTYKIGKQFTVCPYRYTQADVDALNAEINDLRARQPRVIEKVVEKVTIKGANVAEVIVLFNKNSTALSENAKVMLNGISGDVEVIGSASPEGSVARNAQLASDRANVVADYLKGRNINVKKVTTDLNIGSRTVIVK